MICKLTCGSRTVEKIIVSQNSKMSFIIRNAPQSFSNIWSKDSCPPVIEIHLSVGRSCHGENLKLIIVVGFGTIPPLRTAPRRAESLQSIWDPD